MLLKFHVPYSIYWISMLSLLIQTMSRIDEIGNNPSLTFKDSTDDQVYNIGCRYILPEDIKIIYSRLILVVTS